MALRSRLLSHTACRLASPTSCGDALARAVAVVEWAGTGEGDGVGVNVAVGDGVGDGEDVPVASPAGDGVAVMDGVVAVDVAQFTACAMSPAHRAAASASAHCCGFSDALAAAITAIPAVTASITRTDPTVRRP